MTDYVISGASSGTYTLASGDTLTVSSGGASSQSVLGSGSTETIHGFASGNGDIVNGGTQFVYGGATRDVISAGAVAVGVGASLLSTTQQGGQVFLSADARMFSSTINGGTTFVYGSAYLETATLNGGTLSVSGGQADGVTIGAGGTEQIYLSGRANGDVVAGNQFVNSGGSTTGQSIAAGGTQTVSSGGTAVGVTVAGSQVVSGGIVIATTVSSGGNLTVNAGSAVRGTITSGGTATVMAGAVISGATVSAGGELLLQGGTALGSIANAGDVTFTFGTSNTFTGALSGTGTVTVGGSAVVVLAGSNTATGTTTIGYNGSLELTSAGAAGSGAIVFGTGTGQLILDGAMPTNVISGVLPYGTDQIVLTNLGSSAATITQNGDFVTVSGGGITDTLDIAGSGAYSFSGTTSGGAFVLTEQAACFLRGGRIATPGGEVPVETLRAGDLVLLEGGAAVPVRWVGFGSGPVTDANRCDIAPVVIRAGALADGVPHRDLRLTRRHGVRVGDVLVPVELLVNDRSVVWDEAATALEIFHVEIEGHGILLAEGAPAESFRDDGSAHLFGNLADRPAGALPTAACLPVITGGPALEAAWRTVADRAAALHTVTGDADLHLEIDGQRVVASSTADGVHRFRVKRPSRDILLRSRSTIPAAMGLGADQRRLGIALTGLELNGVRHAPDVLAHGVHPMEPEGHRWTKGRTVLPASLFTGSDEEVELSVHVTAMLRYRSTMATAAIN